MKNANESGYLWFDFNTSGGNKGVISFKKGFGAREVSCPITSFDSRLEALSKQYAKFIFPR
jgi:lipid II:glycine glycyltransferase (peptidoglycan interpeptide bridge formation enzyme)